MEPPETDSNSDRPRADRLLSSAPDPGALPVAPGFAAVEEESDSAPDVLTPHEAQLVDKRTIFISAAAMAVALGAGLLSQVLIRLIALFTNVAFYGRVSAAVVSPADAHAPWFVILLVPIVGGLIVGVLARYGSASIRGHGIPEVMERVIHGESRIPARVMVLKPVSAAIAPIAGHHIQ